jgi:hypothetical protein
MSISRPFLLVLVGAVLLGATGLAVQNARDRADGGSTATPAAEQATGQPSGASADQTLSAAFAGNGGLDSGKFEADLSLTQVGGQGQSARIGLDGAFESRASGEMPFFQIALDVRAGDRRLSAGAVSVGDRAYLLQRGVGHRVPSALWTELRQARRQIASYAQGGAASSTPGVLGLDPRTWLKDVNDEGEAQLDGVTTKHVSASVDAAALLRDLAPLARQGGVQAGLPRDVDKSIAKVVKQADVDVYVGQDDRILRRLRVALDLDFSQASAAAAGQAGRAKILLDFRLTDVNEPQHIVAPQKVAPGAGDATSGALSTAVLGVGVLAVDPPPGLAQARKAGFRIGQVTSPAPVTNNPRKAARAVRAHRKVVIFFRNPRGLDDQATAEAVRGLRGRTKAAIFTDDIRSVDRYGSILEDVGVNQAPAVVIIDRRGAAHLVEGYVDADALAQEVADVR